MTINTNGVTANGQASEASLSGGGKVVAFDSSASDLAPGTGSVLLNVFVRNLIAGTTALVSANTNGSGEGNDISWAPQVTRKGQHVFFVSVATDLAPNATHGTQQVFVRDLLAETTRLVSVNTNGQAAAGPCGPFAISPNGRFVVFVTAAPDLVPGDTNGLADVFLRDLALGTTTLVSVGCDGEPADGDSNFPQVSADGRYVTFASAAPNLVAGVPSGWQQVYRRDLLAGVTELVSRSPLTGRPASGLNYDPAISADGQTVVFSSTATDYGWSDDNFGTDFFVWRSSSVPPAPLPVLTLTPAPGDQLTIAWTPATAGFELQETTSLAPANWLPAPSGTNNPATVPPAGPGKFYRLFKP